MLGKIVVMKIVDNNNNIQDRVIINGGIVLKLELYFIANITLNIWLLIKK